jgi:hypothetical protein
MEGEKASISAVANTQDRKHVEFIKRPQEKKNSLKTGDKANREPGFAGKQIPNNNIYITTEA